MPWFCVLLIVYHVFTIYRSCCGIETVHLYCSRWSERTECERTLISTDVQHVIRSSEWKMNFSISIVFSSSCRLFYVPRVIDLGKFYFKYSPNVLVASEFISSMPHIASSTFINRGLWNCGEEKTLESILFISIVIWTFEFYNFMHFDITISTFWTWNVEHMLKIVETVSTKCLIKHSKFLKGINFWN